jgi:hypothetical protein
MDDTRKTHDPVGSGLGAQSGGWQDTNRDVVNPADRNSDDQPGSDLIPLTDDTFGDDEENSDLADPMPQDDGTSAEPSEDDDFMPTGSVGSAAEDGPGNGIIQHSETDEDPAEDADVPAR